MKSKLKAKLVTFLMFVLLVVLGADVVAVVPKALPWVLGVLAVPGSVWFCKMLYRWLTEDEDADDTVLFPLKKPKQKPYAWYKMMEEEK